MKTKILSALCLVLLFSACQKKDEPKSYLDTNTYNIEDEFSLSVLMYDEHNTLVLQALRVENNNPDQRGQIEALAREDANRVWDAELRVYYMHGLMNQLELKKRLIAQIQQENINLMVKAHPLDIKVLHRVLGTYVDNLDEAMDKQKERGIPLEGAVVDYIMFNPQVDWRIFEQGLPVPMINSAIKIAASRFDNIKVYDDAMACLDKAYKDKNANKSESMDNCMQEYRKQLSAEAVKVVEQLKPYKAHFAISIPVPPAEDMEKQVSEDGSYHQWVPKKREK